MPHSGLWRKKLIAIKFCAAVARCLPMQDFRLPPTSETGCAESLIFPSSQGIRFSRDGVDTLSRIREAQATSVGRPSVRPRRRAKAGA